MKRMLSCWPFVARLAFAILMLACTVGCSDIEYDQKLATTRTDWKGNEVIGIWVSKFSIGPMRNRFTLLLRPDGTGRQRLKALGMHREYPVSWHYSGGGKWAGVAQSKPHHSYDFAMNYNGSELLIKTSPMVYGRMVFVPADNEAAVEEYLKKR